MKMICVACAFLMAGLFVLAGCASGKKAASTRPSTPASSLPTAGASTAGASPTVESRSSTPSADPHDQTARKYLTVIGGSATSAGSSLTQPGSLAAMYIEDQVQQARAAVADGDPYPTQGVRQVHGGWQLYDPSAGKVGNTFSDFKYTSSGRIVTLSINKKPLAGRLARGGDMSGGGVELTHVVSYKSVGGLVFVTFDAHNTRSDQSVRIEYRDYNVPPTLVSVDGQQISHDVQNSVGPTDLQPGATSSYVLAFPAPDVGREFHIELLPNVALNEIYVSTHLVLVK